MATDTSMHGSFFGDIFSKLHNSDTALPNPHLSISPPTALPAGTLEAGRLDLMPSTLSPPHSNPSLNIL